jgi:hypothetical protein
MDFTRCFTQITRSQPQQRNNPRGTCDKSPTMNNSRGLNSCHSSTVVVEFWQMLFNLCEQSAEIQVNGMFMGLL